MIYFSAPTFRLLTCRSYELQVRGAVRSTEGEANHQRLGAVPVPSEEGLTNREDNSREKLHPGSVSPVWMMARAHDLDGPEGWPPLNSVTSSAGESWLRQEALDLAPMP